jgi:predicted RNA-binding Zn-ribbon protein involved in translation (DUF1610 family)
MNFLKSMYFNLILVFGFWLLFLSLYDIFTGREWMLIILILYAISIILMVTIILYLFIKKPSIPISVKEFEKRLKGGLYHFKCPKCSGIFAVKKSKGDNKKIIKMTCPDCGIVGVIPPNPKLVEEEIPEKKSGKVNFECKICGEGITVWAEGTDLYKKVAVYTCPFCGEQEPLKKL